MNRLIALVFAVLLSGSHLAQAGPVSAGARETAQWIVKKFGPGRVGKTVDEIALATGRTVEKHGDEALPLLRATGHAGFDALESAGKQAPDVIKLFARRGDEAVWVISQPKKLTIFLRHGDNAADALLKHPGIADDLIERFGSKALAPLQRLEKTGAQQMAMAAKEGVFEKTARSTELLDVIGKYGDRAMEFIWKNKGPLAVGATLAAFLHDPEPFIQGAKDLVVGVVTPIGTEIAKRTNWTPVMIVGIVAVVSLLALRLWRRRRHVPTSKTAAEL